MRRLFVASLFTALVVVACTHDFDAFESAPGAPDATVGPDATITPVSDAAPEDDAGDAGIGDAGPDATVPCDAGCIATEKTCRDACDTTEADCAKKCGNSIVCIFGCQNPQQNCRRTCTSTCQACGGGKSACSAQVCSQ